MRSSGLDPVDGISYAFVLRFQAVDQSPLFFEAQETRLLAAILRLRGERPDLNESEAEIGHFVDTVAVGIESACKAYGIAEIEPEKLSFQ